MDLRQLRYFLAIVNAGSFSKAALHCNVVQSALSQQIAALEAELEKPLLIRSAHGVSTTRAGALLYQHAQHILRQVEHARSVMRDDDDEPTGPVSIGLPTSTAATLSLPLLEACITRYPKIELRILEGLSRRVLHELNSAVIDIAVLFSGQSIYGLKWQPLLTEELFVVEAAPSKRKRRLVGTMSSREFSQMPLLLPERGNGLRDLIDDLFASIGISITPLVELGSLSTMLEAVKHGFGGTILPWGAFSKDHAQGLVAAHRLEHLCMPRTLMLCTSVTLPVSDAARAVYQLVQEVVNDLVIKGQWKEVHLRHR